MQNDGVECLQADMSGRNAINDNMGHSIKGFQKKEKEKTRQPKRLRAFREDCQTVTQSIPQTLALQCHTPFRLHAQVQPS
eukprot:scaffold125005_cov19-Tisochrysis_lutea.AAC.1